MASPASTAGQEHPFCHSDLNHRPAAAGHDRPALHPFQQAGLDRHLAATAGASLFCQCLRCLSVAPVFHEHSQGTGRGGYAGRGQSAAYIDIDHYSPGPTSDHRSHPLPLLLVGNQYFEPLVYLLGKESCIQSRGIGAFVTTFSNFPGRSAATAAWLCCCQR